MKIITKSEKITKIFNNIGLRTIISNDDGIDYIDIDDNDNFITFTAKPDINNPWNSNRNKIKIGRFIKKIIDFDDQSIESLVNQYKTYYSIETGQIDKIFTIFKGKDIWKYYLRQNTVLGGGSLSTSCMLDRPEEQFKLYTENPDVINLLTILNGKKIIGRSLLWKLEDGSYYLDRPYVRYDKDINLYHEYAKKMNYKNYFNDRTTHMSVIIKNKYLQLPYLDTFKKITTSKTMITKRTKYRLKNFN
jgi:hypothetical protein